MSLPTTFSFKTKKEVSLPELFSFFQLKFCWIYIGNVFIKIGIIVGEFIVKISKGICRNVTSCLIKEKTVSYMTQTANSKAVTRV